MVQFFINNPVPDEVNFWTPTPWNIRKLTEGDTTLFLLKSPFRKICGYGSFKYYENLSIEEAWLKFGSGNGVDSLFDLISIIDYLIDKRFSSYRILENTEIGCIVLSSSEIISSPLKNLYSLIT